MYVATGKTNNYKERVYFKISKKIHDELNDMFDLNTDFICVADTPHNCVLVGDIELKIEEVEDKEIPEIIGVLRYLNEDNIPGYWDETQPKRMRRRVA